MAPRDDLTALVQAHRIGHLATADSPGTPHLVPICFVYDGHAIYSAIDHKPKRRTGYGMKRIRNILENPRVAFLVHHYEEDWQQLSYVLIRSTANANWRKATASSSRLCRSASSAGAGKAISRRAHSSLSLLEGGHAGKDV